MPITYDKAPEPIEDMVRETMTRYHPVLTACDVTVDVLLATKTDAAGNPSGHALKAHGYPAAATIKITPLKQRALDAADALLLIDTDSWGDLTPEERIALLDHELEHLQVAAEKDSSPSGVVEITDSGKVGIAKVDDLGRPKLKIRLHDWQLGGFRSVAGRHGSAALEVQAVKACRDTTGQWFWDFGGEEDSEVEEDSEGEGEGAPSFPASTPIRRRKKAAAV